MGFPAPANIVEADLNGTGVLVDVSQWVDWRQGLSWSWGRTDWSADTPAPGVLSFVLDNADGRFTPGNHAVYSVGVVDGVRVRWTCGGRVRWLVMDTPGLDFPAGTSVSARVRVQCYDAVGQAARSTLRSMYDEEVLKLGPVAYWRLDESGSGLAPRPADSSGAARSLLVPQGDPDGFGWANGYGPAADPGAALHLWSDAASAPAGDAWLESAMPLLPGWFAAADGSTQWALGIWFTIKAVYQPTDPPVHLATVTMDAGKPTSLWWRPADGSLVIYGDVGTPTPTGANGVGSVSKTRTHMVVIANWSKGTSSASRLWLDGSFVADYAGGSQQSPTRVRLGSADPAVFPGASAHAGTVARVAVWPAAAMGTESVWPWVFPTFPAAYTLWRVGQVGSPESVASRAARLAGYRGLTVGAQGTDRGDQVGRQDTAGQSVLAALCDALRTEDAAVDSGDTKGQLRPWLYSTQRPGTSSFTVDVEADGHDVPEVSFDTSAVASTVTVSSPTVSATWTVPDPGRWPGTSTQVESALTASSAAVSLAQYRAAIGRLQRAVPSRVTVDAASAEHDLAAALLALRPGARITVAGFASAWMGYDSVDAIVVGGREDHTEGRALVTLQLQPLDGLSPRWALYDGVSVQDVGRLQPTPGLGLAADVADVDVAIPVLEAYAGAGSVPYVVQVDAEQMLVTAVSGGGKSLTVTRGYHSTAAVAHTAGTDVKLLAATGVLGY